MSKLLIAGDTHGNIQAAEYLSRRAHEHGCSRVYQVGDFSLSLKERFLEQIMKDCDHYGIQWFWNDGNHDNFDYLEEERAFGVDHMTELWPDIFYVPRGHAWEWDGRKFLACGGAFSVDKGRRTDHYDWFFQETIRDRDVAKCRQAGEVDVVFTHDAPHQTQTIARLTADNGHTIFGGGYKADADSAANRWRVREIMNHANPAILFHGHFHHDYHEMLANTFVVGLHRDGWLHRSYVVLDLETMIVSFPEPDLLNQ